jgi:hypothetical protein
LSFTLRIIGNQLKGDAELLSVKEGGTYWALNYQEMAKINRSSTYKNSRKVL